MIVVPSQPRIDQCLSTVYVHRQKCLRLSNFIKRLMIFSIYLFARQLKTFKMQILIKLALYPTISCTSNDLFIVQCDDENIVGHVVTQA